MIWKKPLLLVLFLMLPVASFSASHNVADIDKKLVDMELHWKKILAEGNLSKRQRLLKDHANIMMDIEAVEKKLSPAQRKSRHHQSNNILEIHHMMMNTMVK